MLSVAFAETDIVPETVPAEGAVRETDGAVVSAGGIVVAVSVDDASPTPLIFAVKTRKS